MDDEVVEMELDFYNAGDDDHFESDFDDSVLSVDDKQGGRKTDGSQQTSTVVDNAEKLSDHQVLEAVNTLLKVCIIITFCLLAF